MKITDVKLMDPLYVPKTPEQDAIKASPMPSYGSGINLHLSIDELLQQMTSFVKEGFPMVKMKIGRRDTHEDLERTRLVREAIGPKIDLAVDVNNGLSLQTAIRMSRKIEPYDIYWLEEPILVDEIPNLAALARETSIPIAVGETHHTKWEFKELMEQGAVGIAQADPGMCGGGGTEFIKIAALSDACGLPVCPHHSPYVDVPLLAAVPNGMIHEHIDNNTFAMEQVGIDPIATKNGEIVPSTKPGLGSNSKMRTPWRH